MKNKLLKISTLFVFIAFCSYFLYQNDCFETSNHENVSTQKQTKIEKPILNTENKQLNLVAKHSNEADKNVTVIIDEAFIEFTENHKHNTFMKEAPRSRNF